MIIEFSRKQPTLLVAETEEAGALPQVLRLQTSRCVVLDIVVRVVHGALVVFVAFFVHVVLVVLVVLDLAVCVVHCALVVFVAFVVHVVLVVLVVLVVVVVLVVLELTVHEALIALVILVVVVVPGETKAIWPLTWIQCPCLFC